MVSNLAIQTPLSSNTSVGRTSPIDNPPSPFKYQPLAKSVDCTRLVEIELAKNGEDPLCCKLIEVTFGSRPKFEALSHLRYDKALTKVIYVDGKEFLVGKNLWNALKFLRKRTDGTRYWIDAISLDQNSIAERNRHLRFIPFIFARATTVLVWLDTDYSTHGQNDEDSVPTSQLDQLVIGTPASLPSDDYWRKAWTIQELVKARKIKVCYDDNEIDWNDFISQNSDGEGYSEGPLKIEKERQEKYENGHALCSLLEAHRSVTSNDSRDNIYAFVGLATDTTGFPMDYEKTLWDVWRDTVLFANKSKMLRESEILPFGRLVKDMLGGSSVGTPKQIPEEESVVEERKPAVMNYHDNNPAVFKLAAYIVGYVVHKGPSPEEVLSSLDAEDKWRGSVQENFSKCLGNAFRDSDRLIEALEGSADANIGVVTFKNTRLRWKPSINTSASWSKVSAYVERSKQLNPDNFLNNSPNPSTATKSKPSQTVSDSWLYQLGSVTKYDPHLKMGIAAEGVQIGDLICYVGGAEKALIVRVAENNVMQTIGTAIFTQDICGESMKDHAKHFSREEEFVLGVGAETVYVLLS
jgi:hypothetical protein